jgi:hypothetical protein
MLEWTVGVARLRHRRKVALLATILRWVVVTSSVVVALVVLATTSVVAAVCFCSDVRITYLRRL